MAISRVPGYSLLSNLDRQGTDLSITSAGQTLIKFDVVNYRVGINSTNPSESLEVVGNLLITDGNLLTSANLTYNLGSETNWWNKIFVANISADNFSAEYISGTLTTNAQPNITSLGTLSLLEIDGNLTVSNQILPSGNVSGTVGNASAWWNTIYANTINAQGIYGSILTPEQYNITNLGNITVNSISVGGNILITGNTSGGIINADELYESNNRVLTEATNISVSGDATGTGAYTNIPLTLANTGVTAGTYGSNIVVTQWSVDSKGRILSAGNVTLNRVGNINVNDNTITTVSGDINLSSNVANLNVTKNISANTVNLTSSLLAPEIYENGFRPLTTNTNIQVNGDLVGSGTYSNVFVELSNTGVTAGVYGSADDEYADRIPKVTVDSKGRITNIANVTLTQVGNVTFTNTTISTTSNITLAPANGYIFANSSVITNVADPISAQDVVTLNYLNTQLSSAANVLSANDSVLSINDDGITAGNLELTLDGNVVANINALDTNIYSANLNVGNFTISANTISAPGNIVIDAQSSGIVQIAGADAVWVPSGNSATRPLIAEEGYLRYNTDINLLEFYDGNTWTYPGAATISSDTITPDGSNVTYTLSTATNSADGLLVSINGTLQRPGIAYTVAGDQITFTEVPQTTDIIEVRYMAAGATTVKALSYGATEVLLTTGNVNVTGNILPTANVTYDLGSEAYQWRDLWLSGNTIHIGGAQISTIGGNVTFTPAGSDTPIDLTADTDPTLLTAGNSNVKVRLTSVNVKVNSTEIASFDAAGFNVSGNVTATRFIGDASYLTGLPTQYANANVDAYLPGYSGSIGSLDTAVSNINSKIDGANSAIVSANTALKNYTDTSISSNIATVNSKIDGANSAIVTANTALKNYTDTSISSNIATVNSKIDGANTATTTANTTMRSYVDGQIAGVLNGTTFTGTVAIPTLTLTNALGINYGGTGGTSSSEALNNLLPSGEISGYVLKTSGPGSYYWSAETGSGGTVGTQITTSRTYYTATTGQTVYTGLTYTPGAGQLRVYINGVRQFDSAYTESNSSAFTLGAGVSSGTVVLAEVDAYTDYNVYANATYSTPVGTISASTVQDALAELDSEKAALTGAAFTGNISTTGNLSVTSTLRSTSSTSGALVVSGGVGIGGNLYIGGNLQVAGNVTYFDSNNVTFNDAMIYLADDNTGDVLDIGFVSSFTNSGYQHTGLVRDASDGTWKLFANVVAEPTTTIDFTNATYSNLRIGNLTSVGATLTGNLSAGNISATNLTGTLSTASQTNITSVGTLTGLTVSGAPVPNANVSVNLGSTSAWWNILYANTYVGATATFTGNITAGNVNASYFGGTLLTASQPNITTIGTLGSLTVTGNVSAANLTSSFGLWGTVRTAAQTNITSVGTLTGLTVSGAITPNANLTANIGSSSSWFGNVFAGTYIGTTGTFSGTVTAGTLSGSISSSMVTTALGYTPYNGATNPNGYLTTAVTSLAGTTNQITASASTGSVTLSLPQSINTAANVQFGSFGVGAAASGTTGEIRATNNITAYYSSDARFKENIRDIPDALDKVSSIGGKLFDWTDEYLAQHGGEDDYFLRKSDFGVVAQDVQAVFPEAVRVRPDGTLAVDYEKLAALSFAALKELSIRVSKLEGK